MNFRIDAARKFFLAMKLTVFLLTVFSLHVSAGAYSQKISISFEDASLETVMKEISRQSSYDFLFDAAYLKNAKPITIKITGADIKETLKQVFKGQPFTYSIDGKAIIVKPKSLPDQKKKIKKLQNLIQGKVTDTTGAPLPGVAVQVKGTRNGTLTNTEGEYKIEIPEAGATLVFSLLGFRIEEQPVNARSIINVVLRVSADELNEVMVVSTGYQQIPKERATGSFTHISSELLNRRVSTNILDRLEGIAGGVLFPNKNIPNGSNESPISIRGRSTIFANTTPLVVVDNFPYDGDISNINPNTIESITILKDAAAASIWGVRAGNGVIVITTKKGRVDQPLQIELNSNVTIGHKPDLFYNPNYLNASDFIDVELFLFEEGYYDSDLSNTESWPVVSPVVEILYKKRAGIIDPATADAQIEAYRNLDIRKDFEKYLYRSSINQQYSLKLTGGGQKTAYAISGGIDRNLSPLVRNSYNRYTLNTNNTFTPLRNLELGVALGYTQSTSRNNNPGYGGVSFGKSFYYPYAQLTDAEGKPLAVVKDYRYDYIDTTGQGKLLDWRYRPIEEIELTDNTRKAYDIRFTPSIRYTFFKGIDASINYRYQKVIGKSDNLHRGESYFSRDLINLYTGTDGTHNVPVGGILDWSDSEVTSQRLRTQLNFNRTFSDNHELNFLAGYEFNEIKAVGNSGRLYGYNEEILTYTPVDYKTRYPQWQNIDFDDEIPDNINLSGTTDIFISWFANAAYAYKGRYVLSGSARIDQSNLFGVNANQKAVPLWSIGASWDISKENFYNVTWLSYLKLRTTYGYSGNIDKSLSAYTTGMYGFTNDYGLLQGSIINPPNKNLRWEKSALLNFGIDFASHDNRFGGSLEFYTRKGEDLIGNAELPPSTGKTSFKGNVADIKGHGIDVEVYGKIINGNFNWRADLLFSSSKNEITNYNIDFTSFSMLQSGGGATAILVPIVGKPLYGLYSYRWAGLDPETGDPRGIFNGEISTDYSSIRTATDPENLVYHGPARPTVFGGFRNTFSFKNFSASVNIVYKLGYYFRRSSVNYNESLSGLFTSWSSHEDYMRRWQQPGDETITNIPSMVYPGNSQRDIFYNYSEPLVEGGDHIRLQDIQLMYDFNQRLLKDLPVKNVRLYVYANNLGLLWKANKSDLDPDFVPGLPGSSSVAYIYPAPRTIAFGLKADF